MKNICIWDGLEPPKATCVGVTHLGKSRFGSTSTKTPRDKFGGSLFQAASRARFNSSAPRSHRCQQGLSSQITPRTSDSQISSSSAARGTRWQLGVGDQGAFWGHLGSVSPPCPPRKEGLHLELCVLTPPRTVRTWIAGNGPPAGSPSLSPSLGENFGIPG